MTLSPTDYRAWRSEAAERDHAFAAGYRAGLADGHRHREGRLVAVGIVVALLLLGRRIHPLAGLAVALAVVVAFWPVLFLVLVAELTVRHHRRHRHWGRTLAYGVSWLVGAALVLLAVASVSPWPLVGLGVLVGAWTAGPSLAAFVRRHRGRGKGPGTGSGSSVDPTWLPPFADDDATLPGPGTRHQARAAVRCRPTPPPGI